MDSMLMTIINPLQLTLQTWLLLCVLKSVAEAIFDEIIVNMLTWMKHPQLPSRVLTPEKAKGLEALRFIDYTYLFINTFVETTFIMNLLRFAIHNSPLDLADVTPFNTIVAIYVCFIVDDAIYYVLHRIMHIPAIYSFIHKHHHRQTFPKRGYWDAANEHPIEQMGGLACVWIALHICVATTGFHGAAILVFFGIYATMAMMNHMPFDVQFGWLGLGYSARAHESHHVYLRGNYAQNTMVFDQLMGTFIAYRGGGDVKNA